ncbi:MAG: acyl-CoA dehydrogenase family protein [Rhizobium sp.]|nr:acyl-CoA dehydrogenase family protein [Rhizobium sp.]
MSGFSRQADRTLGLLKATPGWLRLQALRPDCDDATVAAILREAGRFAETVLHLLDRPADRQGCRVEAGRVRTPDGFAAAYAKLGAAGWIGTDVAETLGGLGLPLVLHTACASMFERGCVSFMMAAGASRAACHLLAGAADSAVAAEWVPRLVAGEWAATICISEPDAGSDVGRLRTRAECIDGVWRISGQKCWISFGDHDMAARIGHCLLARTEDKPGTGGLSLFLVPNLIDGQPNGITLDRIEEKMGLHGSPTCALTFQCAQATLIGEPGRGLAQLFAMIELMRLSTACQGLGVASSAVDIAKSYAAERRQGGPADRPPVPIAAHPDVRRQLDGMRRQTEILRAAVLELACAMDLARIEPDLDLRREHADLAGWMLPLIKNFGAQTGFDVANAAIQVLGGAGYTRDYPLEQHLRDSRIMTIYEGTTGMQALDFLTRRLWRDEGRGLRVFLRRSHAELDAVQTDRAGLSASARDEVASFRALSDVMMELRTDSESGLGRADEYFTQGWRAVSAWLSIRV